MSRIAFLALLLIAGAAAADSGVVTRDTALLAEPYSDAQTLKELSSGTAVAIEQRRGGWYRARASGAQGWLRLTSVRLKEAKQNRDQTALGNTLRFAKTGRSGSRDSTATTGIRGIDKEALAKASPNYSALETLDDHAVDAAQASKFARKHGLSSQP